MTHRTVVITGGTAGVGRATARAFASRGCAVAILARGEDGLAGVHHEIVSRGARALTIECDVADADAVEAAADRIESEMAPIDVWVNNAMTTIFAPTWEITAEEFQRATEVTYLGGVHGTLAALRRMRPRDRGVIVNVGSALAYRAIPLQAAYCGAKHALRGFTDALRCELIHDRSAIHVTMVHLPGLNTPQFSWCRSRFERHPQPVPPVYAPEVAAEAVVWASENRRREHWVGLPTYKTIWGGRLIPGLLDHYMADRVWEGQLMDERVPEDRQDNLFEPVRGDFGAHGRFGAVSRTNSPVARLDRVRPWLAAGLSALLAGAAITRLTAGD